MSDEILDPKNKGTLFSNEENIGEENSMGVDSPRGTSPRDSLENLTETQKEPAKNHINAKMTCRETFSRESSRKTLLGNLNSDLKTALNSWDVITEQSVKKVSPGEEKLQDMKKLLSELKSKIAEFND